MQLRAFLSLALTNLGLRAIVAAFVLLQYVKLCSYTGIPLWFMITTTSYMLSWIGIEVTMLLAFGLPLERGSIVDIVRKSGDGRRDGAPMEADIPKEKKHKNENSCAAKKESQEWVMLPGSDNSTNSKSDVVITSTTNKDAAKILDKIARPAWPFSKIPCNLRTASRLVVVLQAVFFALRMLSTFVEASIYEPPCMYDNDPFDYPVGLLSYIKFAPFQLPQAVRVMDELVQRELMLFGRSHYAYYPTVWNTMQYSLISVVGIVCTGIVAAVVSTSWKVMPHMGNVLLVFGLLVWTAHQWLGLRLPSWKVVWKLFEMLAAKAVVTTMVALVIYYCHVLLWTSAAVRGKSNWVDYTP